MSGRKWSAAVLVGAFVALGVPVAAEEIGPPRDVDVWHAALADAIGGELCDEPERRWTLGLYPGVGIALGPPEWVAYQFQGYLSVGDGRSFSLFAGYGYERGPESESHMATLGWGGVRNLSAARPARGFHGKFLRYRRIRDFTHGIHQGLSVGAETGAGLFALAFEFGAARSPRNHWAITAQLGLKIAVPIIIPLSRSPGTDPDT